MKMQNIKNSSRSPDPNVRMFGTRRYALRKRRLIYRKALIRININRMSNKTTIPIRSVRENVIKERMGWRMIR